MMHYSKIQMEILMILSVREFAGCPPKHKRFISEAARFSSFPKMTTNFGNLLVIQALVNKPFKPTCKNLAHLLRPMMQNRFKKKSHQVPLHNQAARKFKLV